MKYDAGRIDVAVIGAGHAGIEAGLASARLGCKTEVFTVNLDWVGNMPCNPSIGGTSKGHLVREIDALGGEMGLAADANTLQMRMLNLGKGPAVHSPRAQIDRRAYSAYMKRTLEEQENLTLRQAEIVDIYYDSGEWVLTTRLEAVYRAKCVVLATGTFLGGRVYIGDVSYESGPDGMFPATELSKSLKALGLPLRRFKTGTPARVNRRSVETEKLEPQFGDEDIVPFSFTGRYEVKNTRECYVTYTGGGDEESYSLEPPPLAALFRKDRRSRSALLPEHRGQNSPLLRKGATSDIHRTLRLGDWGDVSPGSFIFAAGGCAARIPAHYPRVGALRGHAHRICYRI